MRGRRQRRQPDQRGQATVELALALPLAAVLLLAIIQAALLARDQILVVHTAREAARAVAVDPTPDAGQRAAEAAGLLKPERLDVKSRGRGGVGSRVTVSVGYRAPTDVPLVGRLFGDLVLRAEASMRVER